MADDPPRKPTEDRPTQWASDHDMKDEQAKTEGYPPRIQRSNEEPDVLLDVPSLKVDEIDLEVADLHAQVSLRAEVLDLLKLHVGADVTLGRVALKIKGVEAQALLKVRLDNVAAIIDRVLATIEHNPQILEHVTRGLGTAVEQVGRGAGDAVGEIGRGTGGAVRDVGRATGEALEEVGHGAGDTVKQVGRGTRDAVEEVGEARRQVAEEVGGRVRSSVERADATAEAGRRPSREVPRGAGQAARRAPPRAGQTEQAEQTPPRRARGDQPQRPRARERARGEAAAESGRTAARRPGEQR